MTELIKLPFIKEQQKLDWLALFSILFAVFILALAPILIRFCAQEVSPNALVFDRFWMAGVLLGIWEGSTLIYRRASDPTYEPQKLLTKGDIGLFVLAAGFGSFNIAAWTWSLTQTNIATANLLHNMTPFFATTGAWLFLGQKFDQKFLIGLVLAMSGAFAIGIEDIQLSTAHLEGDGLALLSAILYAGNVLCLEKLRAKFTTNAIMFWSCLLRSLWMLPLVFVFEKKNILPVSVQGWVVLLSLVLLVQVLAQGIVLYNLKRFSSSFVSLFILLDPIIAAVLAWAIFAENLSFINWMAFFIVLSGIYLAKSSQGSQKMVDENEVLSEMMEGEEPIVDI